MNRQKQQPHNSSSSSGVSDGEGGGSGGGGGSRQQPSASPAGLPSTESSQHLIVDSDSLGTSSVAGGRSHAGVTGSTQSVRQYGDGRRSGGISMTEWFAVIVLCFVNLINYMDRFTIAGVLTDIQKEFNIGDDQGGLLQTAFVISYMIFAPIFGYLGDRYSRKWIMILGVALWSGTTLAGSYMSSYGSFLAFRALVGIGEASYSTIAPTIISDLFVHEMRSKMLAMFYFAIPVGSGFGYIVGSKTAMALDSWRWALRVTPALGLLAVVLIFLTKEPARGQSEGSHSMESTSYAEDLKDLARNPSFMLSTGGFTCVAFVTGALAWWGPTFILAGLRMQAGNENVQLNDVAFVFGAITMVAGIVGVPLGTLLAQVLKKRYPRADPLICAGGLLISAPFLMGAMLIVPQNTVAAYAFIFLGSVALNLNWAIVADILLYVVLPTRRSTAEAFQILISHTLGDAGSPYLIGVMSEAIKAALRVANSALNDVATTVAPAVSSLEGQLLNSTMTDIKTFEDSNDTKFRALQYSLFTTTFVEVLGGAFFLITAVYILRDKSRAEKAVADCQIVDHPTNISTSSVDANINYN